MEHKIMLPEIISLTRNHLFKASLGIIVLSIIVAVFSYERPFFASINYSLLLGLCALMSLMGMFWIVKHAKNALGTSVTPQPTAFSLPTPFSTKQEEIMKLVRSAAALKTAFESLEAINNELQEEKNRYRTLFDNANDAILIIEQEMIVECNLKTLELFGCHRMWIVGKTLDLLSPPTHIAGQDSVTQMHEWIMQSLAGEMQSFEFEWIYCRQDESLFDAEVSFNRVEFNGHIYIQVLIRDITERKQIALNRLRLAQEQEAKHIALLYSQEIEAKNQDLLRLNQEKNEFLGIVAHDLKNPLFCILGLSDILRNASEQVSLEKIVGYAGMIETSAQNMLVLISNLLDVNKIESGEFELKLAHLDLQPLLKKVVSTYSERAQLKQLKIQVSSVPALVYLDESMMQEILENLLSNAIKYSPPAHNIYVSLSITPEDKVRCEIQDEGQGLSAADQAKLFGKFTRLSAKPTGGEHSTGLGLFIVKKLVTALHGEVWCESELGKGARFIVEFNRDRSLIYAT
jgi:PAS domain S-box-containing protein